MSELMERIQSGTYEWKSANVCPEPEKTIFAVWKYTHPRIEGKSWLTGDSELLAPPERAFGISVEKQWEAYKNDVSDGVLLAWMYESDFERVLRVPDACIIQAYNIGFASGHEYALKEQHLDRVLENMRPSNLVALLKEEGLIENVVNKGAHIEMDLKTEKPYPCNDDGGSPTRLPSMRGNDRMGA